MLVVESHLSDRIVSVLLLVVFLPPTGETPYWYFRRGTDIVAGGSEIVFSVPSVLNNNGFDFFQDV